MYRYRNINNVTCTLLIFCSTSFWFKWKLRVLLIHKGTLQNGRALQNGTLLNSTKSNNGTCYKTVRYKTVHYKTIHRYCSTYVTKGGQTAILVRWSAAQRTTEMLADQRTEKNSGPAPADYRNWASASPPLNYLREVI
jgi:hypothetical protein